MLAFTFRCVEPDRYTAPLDNAVRPHSAAASISWRREYSLHTRSSRVQPPLFGVGRLLAAELTEPINVVPSCSTVRGTCQVFRQDSIQVLRQSSSDGTVFSSEVRANESRHHHPARAPGRRAAARALAHGHLQRAGGRQEPL